jgi:hypothetical protein
MHDRLSKEGMLYFPLFLPSYTPHPHPTPPLRAPRTEPLYALRPVVVNGIAVWLGDDRAGPGGVPLADATGILLLMCGAQHLGEVR